PSSFRWFDPERGDDAESFDRFDRHKKWMEVLSHYEIPVLEHTMVTDTLTENGRVSGVMGFHVPSGQVIAASAKAAELATTSCT
ncbi:MAG: hypothetical protein LUE61_09655, partial [Clostridiales bacterium]|nr:hypothetical protein [Clostridiales bacterium]